MTKDCRQPRLPGSPASSRTFAGLAIILGLVLSAADATAQTPTEPLTPPEAVAHLLFSGPTTAMPKTVSPARVTYRGSTIPGEAERTILSISASRADPCLFEAFFIEAPALAGDPKVAVTTAYHATIDLRRLDKATFNPKPPPAAGAQLVLAAKEMFCSRSFILEQTPKLSYNESCLDTIDDAIEPADTPRLRAAFEALRRACRW
jgi:hypothetical protein